MKIALIGNGAISGFVQQALADKGVAIEALIVRKGKEASGQVSRVEDLPPVDLLVDCAGHAGLAQHGPEALSRGLDVVTVSIGALADETLVKKLTEAAQAGQATLHLATGAIGALDALRAARVGSMEIVRYVGRKPPRGWLGSPAETALDLGALTEPATHFVGTAREAALAYPKNANVAAAVALAGVGMDATTVELIADPSASQNVHEIHASGDFGDLKFEISGNSLPDNPRSSALAAMSAVSAVLDRQTTIRF